ncbi:MAG: DUF5683 domain-containing protein [Prevotellaceae bacterium]|nr:DUF5683 domain-containing protein [Prevotellaceae bacterium]
MDRIKFTSKILRLAAFLIMLSAFVPCQAFAVEDIMSVYTDSYALDDSLKTDEEKQSQNLAAAEDAISKNFNDSVNKIIDATDSASSEQSVVIDTLKVKKAKAKRNWSTWRPDAKRAMWLALVIPGAGQIYNRKFWKLPIVYGGILGCIYAMRWNNQMYKDYSQAYMDIMDSDDTTDSYNDFLHLGVTITDDNISRYQTLFQKRKDFYRRYRDLSFFCLVGVYALSVIDAYVDASLSEFDISKDLSFRVEPAILNSGTSRNPLKSSALGLQCLINF